MMLGPSTAKGGGKAKGGGTAGAEASVVGLLALAPALHLAKPKAAVEKGAPPKDGKEKGKLTGKT